LDQVRIYVSTDNSTWIQVFNWGDGTPNTNTTLNYGVIGCAENDNCAVPTSTLIGAPLQTGIGIAVPSGSYRYLRILAPVGGAGDGIDVDSVQILP
jgi:hypothetical protein